MLYIKIRFDHFFTILLVAVSVFLSGCKTDKFLNSSLFKDPPENAKIYTWWHWMDNAISKEGITRDLEAMKAQGVTGTTILNISMFNEKDFGVKPVIFNSPEWWEMYRFAIAEANRLGIIVGIHNCDGWNTSGGPWITPEKSMKQYVWSKTIINGGNKVDTLLAKPFTRMDYYKDVYVIACKAKPEAIFFKTTPRITLTNSIVNTKDMTDGCPSTFIKITGKDTLIVKNEYPLKTSKLLLSNFQNRIFSKPDMYANGHLEVSGDGVSYSQLANFEIEGQNREHSISFPETEINYLKIVFDSIREFSRSDLNWFNLSEIALLGNGEYNKNSRNIPDFLAKTVIAPARELNNIYNSTYSRRSTIDTSMSVNLTHLMDRNGHLKWEAPDGTWEILRFGYTTTGKMNAPSTKAGRGLECDKMDTSAINLHFSKYCMNLINQAGQYKGNTLKYLFIDSWEAGFQNWTSAFPEKFREICGYSIVPFIPALCGEVVMDTELTECFLHDFRKTIAALIDKNYYQQFASLCHQNGIDAHAEVIYGGNSYPPADMLGLNRHFDVPMTEFWTRKNEGNFISFNPGRQKVDQFAPQQSSVLYGKGIIASEAYTGNAHYSETPWEIKLFGDMAFASGINRLVLHSYVHQPNEKAPGMTLGNYASHFNRHNPYWQHFAGFSNYLARQQYILQQGSSVCDVLLYTGDVFPVSDKFLESLELPYGFKAQLINSDMLSKLKVKKGRLILPGGSSYRLLVLPNDGGMELTTAKIIEELVGKGAVVAGEKPGHTLSLTNYEQNNALLNKLTDKIWGNEQLNIYGRGKVFSSLNFKNIFEQIKLQPDFTFEGNPSFNPLFYHKKIGDTDAYYIVNQTDSVINLNAIFRIADKVPQIWDPMDGSITAPAVFINNQKSTCVPLNLQPRQAVFVMFNNKTKGNNIVKVICNGKVLFPNLDPRPLPKICLSDNGYELYASETNNYLLTNANGEIYNCTTTSPSTFSVDNFNGVMKFSPSRETPDSVKITSLKPLNYYENPGIKYYSGTVNYVLTFNVPDSFVNKQGECFFMPGFINATADISLNGKKLGIAWTPFSRFAVDSVLKPGKNILSINVGTVWRNRIIGDMAENNGFRNVWTSANVGEFLNSKSQLMPSGLIGPIIFCKEPKQNIFSKTKF